MLLELMETGEDFVYGFSTSKRQHEVGRTQIMWQNDELMENFVHLRVRELMRGEL